MTDKQEFGLTLTGRQYLVLAQFIDNIKLLTVENPSKFETAMYDLVGALLGSVHYDLVEMLKRKYGTPSIELDTVDDHGVTFRITDAG